MEIKIDKYWKRIMLLLVLLAGFALSGYSQKVKGVYVYPEKNQTKQKQQNDESACYSWAADQASENASGQEQHSRHKALKGGGAGGAAGAIIGGGKGAVIGGAAGAALGHKKQNKNEKQAAQQTNDDFVRAYSSCLRGKGYSVD